MPQWKGNFLGECLAHRKADDFGGCGKRVSCAKTDGPILTIYTSYDVLLQRKCLLGVAMWLLPIQEVKSPKTSLWGVNKHFQAKHVNYQHLHIIENTASIPNKFCTVVNTTKYASCGPNMHITNPRWRAAAILQKNRKIAISQQRFDRSTRNFAQWPHWPPEPTHSYKLQFLKIQDGGWPPFKKIVKSP